MLPRDIADMTLDEVWVLTQDERYLKAKNLVAGTPQELSAMGLLESPKSLEEALAEFTQSDLRYEKQQRKKHLREEIERSRVE